MTPFDWYDEKKPRFQKHVTGICKTVKIEPRFSGSKDFDDCCSTENMLEIQNINRLDRNPAKSFNP
jgi:hypothetical protein